MWAGWVPGQKFVRLALKPESLRGDKVIFSIALGLATVKVWTTPCFPRSRPLSPGPHRG